MAALKEAQAEDPDEDLIGDVVDTAATSTSTATLIVGLMAVISALLSLMILVPGASLLMINIALIASEIYAGSATIAGILSSVSLILIALQFISSFFGVGFGIDEISDTTRKERLNEAVKNLNLIFAGQTLLEFASIINSYVNPRNITCEEYDDYEVMKKNLKEESGITKFLREHKPKGSPAVKRWLDEGGRIVIKRKNGKPTEWIYITQNNDQVSYINGNKGYIVFPDKYLYPDKKISTFSIGKFESRTIDNKEIFKYLDSQDYHTIPLGYAPHHHYENGIIQLVQEDIHKKFTHYGGYYFHCSK